MSENRGDSDELVESGIHPICDRCDQPLVEFGGLLFTPPDQAGFVRKYHLCVTCTGVVVEGFHAV